MCSEYQPRIHATLGKDNAMKMNSVDCCGGVSLAKVALTHKKKKPCNYLPEQRSRGGIKCAANKRDRAYTAIDLSLPTYVKLLEVEKFGMQKARFVMADFVHEVLPWLTNKTAAVRRYGAYIKAKLKTFEGYSVVVRLADLIDKIRAAVARRMERSDPGSLFSQFRGHLMRLSSNPYRTSLRHEGAAWQAAMGIWAYFVTPDGECVI